LRVPRCRGAGASMAAGKADRRADAVGVEERSAVRCPLMKRLYISCEEALALIEFANPSSPSGWVKDFHLQAVDHARHTRKRPPQKRGPKSRVYRCRRAP
jgi:hypothetical protein